MPKLSIRDIVDIQVNLSPRSAVQRDFNLGLFIGATPVIPVEDRVRIYISLDEMFQDGFKIDDPEYKAASLYFQQNKKPRQVAIGRHVVNEPIGETAVMAVAELTVTAISGETGYIVSITDSEDKTYYYKLTAATFPVATPIFHEAIDETWTAFHSGDEITAYADDYITVVDVTADNLIVKAGMAVVGGASVPLALPESTPSEVPESESIVDAVRACRNKNAEWYLVSCLGAAPDEILQVSEYINSVEPASVYMYTTDDERALANTTDSVFAQLKALNRRRSLGQYSVTPDAIAAITGYAMGANTKMSRSAYTLMFKPEVGVMPDDLSPIQIDYLKRQNANYYVSRGYDYDYSMFENGVMADGVFFDEILNLDMLVNDMQLSILNMLRSRPKIPQTEAGVNDIKMAMLPSLDKFREIGFIAPGKWGGPDESNPPELI